MSPEFAEKFLRIVINVINERIQAFTLRTLVNIIWSLAKLDIQNSKGIDEVLISLRKYDRLVSGLESMSQKNQCILFWVYSRNPAIFDKDFVSEIIDAMLSYQGQVFKLDNFDLLLICQSAMHLERNLKVCEDDEFMDKVARLTQMCDTHVLMEIPNFNLHEFTVIVIYYLNRSSVCSRDLRNALLAKLQQCVPDFNEYQLHVFLHTLQELKQEESHPTDIQRIEVVEAALQHELSELQEEKVLLEAEDKIRETIRAKLE